ncbi:MAG TPA: hypothetical protein VFZ53_23190, partial [Polyangiaceae bacterium]
MSRGICLAVLFGAVALSIGGCGDDDDDGDDGGGGTGGGGANVECTPGGGGACQNEQDCPVVRAGTAREATQTCGLGCQQDPDPATCTVTCVAMDTGLTASCATCYALLADCARQNCLSECSTDPDSSACIECQIDE